MSAVFASQGEDRDLTLNFLICCPRCEGPFSLHQPDTDLPDRILGDLRRLQGVVRRYRQGRSFDPSAPPIIGPARF